jgi:(1->4)-alpha-D-glucan 1-alpha-D-glucosylmutase
VDPDNRRPVDYERRRALLAEIGTQHESGCENLAPRLRSMLLSPEDGRCKLYVTFRGLHLRRARPDLFQHGEYVPLSAEGSLARHLVAFARRDQHATVIVVVPRLLAALVDRPGVLPLGAQVWGETAVSIPWLVPQTRLHNVLTGRTAAGQWRDSTARFAASELLEEFPVALLEAKTGSGTATADGNRGAGTQ